MAGEHEASGSMAMTGRAKADRRRARLRWLTVPWSSALIAGSIMAAAATPAFLVVAADVWRAAAQDDVAARAVDSADADRMGIDVSHEVAFDADGLAHADALLRDAVGAIPELADPDRSIFTLPGLLSLGPPVRQVGPVGRLFARPGAIEALELVDELADAGSGVYVSTWFAERHELRLGDLVGFEAGAIVDEQWNDIVQGGGAANVFPIVGLYEPLWSADPAYELPAYWQDVPPEVIPRYIGAFAGPNSELMVAAEDTVVSSGLTGVVRWRAPLLRPPDTFDDLLAYRSRVGGLERSLVGNDELGVAVAQIATVPGSRPRLTSEVGEVTSDVLRATSRLDGPLGSARAVGGIVGLVALVAVGVFLVERRRVEFRLLASEGESGFRIAARVAAQVLAPVAVGAGFGVLAAVVALRWTGRSAAFRFDAVRPEAVITFGVASLVVISSVAGAVGVRTLRSSPPIPPRTVAATVLAVACAAAGFSWVQVGRTTNVDTTEVDLAVVLLPVFASLVAVIVGTWLIAGALRLAVRRPDRWSVPLLIALRRLAERGAGLRIVAGGLGVGVGLLVFAVALTSTLDRTVDVKLATEIGGESALTLVDPIPLGAELPPGTTLVRTSDTQLRPSGERLRVIAIDTATWADGVTWPATFGSGPGEVVEAVAMARDDRIAAVAVVGEPTPDVGAFGLTRTSGFRVVDRTASLPGAGALSSTIVVSAGVVDELAARERGYAGVREAVADGFVLPTTGYRRRLVSQRPIEELVEFAEANGIRTRDPVSREERAQAPSIVAARAAFGYLGVLGTVAGLVAVVGLVLLLEARRRMRALTVVMTRSMGLSPERAALATTIEVVAIVATAFGAAFVAVPFVVRRLSDRFDPAPEVPPAVDVLVSWDRLALVALAALLALAVTVWIREWRAARRTPGEVLRGSD